MHRCSILKIGQLNCWLLGVRVDPGDHYTLRLHVPVADTLLVQRVERFKQLLDDHSNMLLRVPMHLKHVVFQAAEVSPFLQDVKEKIVIDDLRCFDNVWMINSTQGVHFTPVDVLFRICASV